MIRVAIIADTELRARGLAELLAEDERLEVVEAHAVSRGVRDSEDDHADVLIRAGLPIESSSVRGLPTVLLTNAPAELGRFSPAIRAWLGLDATGSEVAAAVIAAASELTVLTAEQRRAWLRAPREAGAESVVMEALTPRELQVLRMIADGFGNKEIAVQLKISEHTAKFHVAQILAKLGAGSRTEAVTLGIRRGMLPV